METNNRSLHLERNPRTHAEHRREVFWQITVPLAIGVLLAIAAAVFIVIMASQPASELRRWADVSLMWLIMPSMIIAFICLVIVVGLVLAVSAILRVIPRYALVVQMYFKTANLKTRQLADKLAEPVLKFNSLGASLRFIRQRGRQLLSRGNENEQVE